ncbi:hypothetical protein [Pedobacter jamesrossensis]
MSIGERGQKNQDSEIENIVLREFKKLHENRNGRTGLYSLSHNERSGKRILGYPFYRVHRSYFVNEEKVEKISGNTLKRGSHHSDGQ